MSSGPAYLTIDDVPSRLFAAKRDFLLDRKVPALLFCQGDQIAGRENELILALQSGFVLGNHSWSHPRFSVISWDECRQQVIRTEELLGQLYDRAGVPWTDRYFRFPYLDRGGSQARILDLQTFLEDRGYRRPRAQAHPGVDTWCTFDQKEYFYGKDDAPAGLGREAGILSLIGPGSPGAGDIILIHDHEASHEIFFRCVDLYLKGGLTFGLP